MTLFSGTPKQFISLGDSLKHLNVKPHRVTPHKGIYKNSISEKLKVSISIQYEMVVIYKCIKIGTLGSKLSSQNLKESMVSRCHTSNIRKVLNIKLNWKVFANKCMCAKDILNQ